MHKPSLNKISIASRHLQTTRLGSAFQALKHSIDLSESEVKRQGPAHEILTEAVLAGATDVHVSTFGDYGVVRFRIAGSVILTARLDSDQAHRLERQLRVLVDLDPVATRQAEHGSGVLIVEPDGHVPFRLTVIPKSDGTALSVRLLDPRRIIQPLSDLGMSKEDLDAVSLWFHEKGGLMLITGPTGSGKTTTFYSCLEHLPTLEQRVVTLEDPVEADLEQIDQIEVNHCGAQKMAHAIPELLRLDPDIIGIGEIRESESARAAVAATLSGHAVVSTAHTANAHGGVDWLRYCGVHDYEIAATLRLVLTQRLVRTLCKACSRPVTPIAEDKRLYESSGREVPDQVFEQVGCDECHGRGYNGRTGVFQVWVPTYEELRGIRSGKDASVFKSNADRKDTLLGTALGLASEGVTSLSEVRRHCFDLDAAPDV
jgi:general secretion pathway protein E